MQGVFHLRRGSVEDGAQDAVLLVGEERGEGVERVLPKKRSMRRMTSGRLALADGVARRSAEKVLKAARSRGRRRSSGLTAAERFWSPRWRTAKQISSVSSVMRERM